MYRCEKCKTVVPAGRKLNRVVTETRTKSYPIFKKAKGKGRRPRFNSNEPVAQAQGWEIATELEVCSACAAEMASATTETAAEEPAVQVA